MHSVGVRTDMTLPIVRSHEIADYKRCPKKWYWHWRKGFVLKTKSSYNALDFGSWVHAGFENWYGTGIIRKGPLWERFATVANDAIIAAQDQGFPDHELEKAEEKAGLGVAMLKAYEKHYKSDADLDIIGIEIPIDFEIPDLNGTPAALYKMKLDAVYRDRAGRIWILEHKTASAIRTEHLTIDGQARPYGAMAERGLRKAGLLSQREHLSGIMYNFLRKAVPDMRETDSEGRALNKNGTVSARQPTAMFVRQPITLTRPAKRATLLRVQDDALQVRAVADIVSKYRDAPTRISKTPHSSCPKFCEYFPPCEAEENGIDVKQMIKSLYRQEDPYAYGETTEEAIGFEMG